jgi:Domain of unknown function (DUF4349)
MRLYRPTADAGSGASDRGSGLEHHRQLHAERHEDGQPAQQGGEDQPASAHDARGGYPGNPGAPPDRLTGMGSLTTWARAVGGLGLAAVIAAGAASGCSSADEDAGSSEEAGGAADHAASPEVADDTSGGEASGGGSDGQATPTALELTAQARDVVRTGSVRLTVDEVDDAVPEIRAIAAGAHGFVADEQVHSNDDTADVTVRVPADQFDRVRDAVGELGDVTAQDVKAQDVTAEMVDLDSRIASQRASVERVRALLGESGDVVQLAAVEGELARRESELESLLGQQRVLADQVALGTLTVHLAEDGDGEPASDGDPAGFTDGLRRGWDAFVDGGRVATAVAGFVLPFALPAAAVVVAVRWWQRRTHPPAPTESHP